GRADDDHVRRAECRLEAPRPRPRSAPPRRVARPLGERVVEVEDERPRRAAEAEEVALAEELPPEHDDVGARERGELPPPREEAARHALDARRDALAREAGEEVEGPRARARGARILDQEDDHASILRRPAANGLG